MSATVFACEEGLLTWTCNDRTGDLKIEFYWFVGYMFRALIWASVIQAE